MTLCNFNKFRMGIMISAESIEVCFGWIGLMWVHSKTKGVLDSLPAMEMGPCNNCGSTDWTAANPARNGKGFSDCNKCGGYEGGPRSRTPEDQL